MIILVVAVGGLAMLFLLNYGKFSPGRTLTRSKRRPAFKTRYGLNVRQSIPEFEERMIVGMSHERNEVWVAAFCTESEVLRVTANVGSRYKCRATDNVQKWPMVARQLGATQIRQYHSHPAGLGCSMFSPQDRETFESLRSLCFRSRLQFRAYLVHPAFLGFKHRIKPFFEE